MGQRQLIGEILVQQGAVNAGQVEAALCEQQQDERRLGELLLAEGALTAVQMYTALAQQLDVAYLRELPDVVGDAALLELLPLGYARQHQVMPLARQENSLLAVLADPFDFDAVNDLRSVSGVDIEMAIAPADDIMRLVNASYEMQAGATHETAHDIDAGGDDFTHGLEPADLLDSDDEAPVIRFVNSLITRACKERASDIHIEPFENELVVRYRIDGLLYEVVRPPFSASASIISRLKIMAGLNIAEKRLPQDGRFRVRIAARDIDVRVSSLPTAFGERLVLRLLDKSSGVLSLSDIGMDERMRATVERLIASPHGVFLVTGPTGSGKTTTLYAALSHLNDREKNIITIEDPIEYQLPGVGQIQVNSKIDLTFANGLRSILRQDPDIIMVGEIRDRETAEIAIQSALTGHMVFSTLHTNDAAGALTRLVEMGIEPFLASSSIVAILAQRLVRTICPHCREEYRPAAAMLEELGGADMASALFYRGGGCDKCMNIGYCGRRGIYELLVVDDEIRTRLMANCDAAAIRAIAVQRGMVSLREYGLQLVRAGETTLEEVIRVTRQER